MKFKVESKVKFKIKLLSSRTLNLKAFNTSQKNRHKNLKLRLEMF